MENSALTEIQLSMAVNKNSWKQFLTKQFETKSSKGWSFSDVTCTQLAEIKYLKTRYLNFISIQTKIGSFKGAKKTREDLKIFSLHSMNSRDSIL